MNVQGKQVINLMACSPIAMFLEHFTMELHRESAVNLLEKVLDCKLRLLGNICKSAPGFVLSRNIERIADLDNNVEVVEQQGEEGLPCTKNEHFVNPRCSASAAIHQASWLSYARNVLSRTSSCLRTAVHPMRSTTFAWICANTFQE